MPTRVLIADDEVVQRMHLKDILTAQGHVVVAEANDGVSAVTQARRTQPDVVILDIRMPGMDGIAAARTITREQIAPVVLLSAYGDQQVLEKAKEAGVFIYLDKPVRETEVAWALHMARPFFHQRRALEDKVRNFEKQVKKLSEQLTARKVIERAKGILMEKRGMSEQAAYRLIQITAMNNRKSMRIVAEQILLANELGA